VGRPRTLGILITGVAAATAAVALARHRGVSAGRWAPGGILIGDAAVYDTQSRILLGPLFRGIAADVASVAPVGARVLEVGCGPGHLSLRLARDHGLDVTGLDLDPAMIERARANAERARVAGRSRPSFIVGDVASLLFPDGSFDVVVSTLSLHHWADPALGLSEIGRVLRPSGRALVWDLRPGIVPLHRDVPDPLDAARGAPLRVVSATPWRWPWRLALAQRIELARTDGATEGATGGRDA
jgi:SAM-dependent methyltransferase